MTESCGPSAKCGPVRPGVVRTALRTVWLSALVLVASAAVAATAEGHVTFTYRAPAVWTSQVHRVNDGTVQYGQTGLRCRNFRTGDHDDDETMMKATALTIESGNTEADYVYMRARFQFWINGAWRTHPDSVKRKKRDLENGYNRLQWTTPIDEFSMASLPAAATAWKLDIRHEWWDHRIIGDDERVAFTGWRRMCQANVIPH